MGHTETTKARQDAATARIDALVAPGPEGERPWRARRVTAGIAVFCVALVALWSLLGMFVDRLPGVQLDTGGYQRSKLVYFEAHRDEFDAVFIGSSQVLRHIHPPTFDEELLLAGHPLTSFNFGLPGMHFAEASHTVDWILDQEPARLKWLFLELRQLDPRLFADNYLTRRQINWHTPRVLLQMCRTVLRSKREPLEKLSRLGLHLHHFLYNRGHFALGLPVASRLLGNAGDLDPFGARVHGCEFIDVEARTDPALVKRHEEFLRERHTLGDRLEKLSRPSGDAVASPWLMESLEDLVARIRAAGVEPVFVISAPTWSAYSRFLDAAERGALPVLFAYNDPVRYPRFYAAESLFDFNHMSSGGALLFTKTLARDFLRYLKSQG